MTPKPKKYPCTCGLGLNKVFNAQRLWWIERKTTSQIKNKFKDKSTNSFINKAHGLLKQFNMKRLQEQFLFSDHIFSLILLKYLEIIFFLTQILISSKLNTVMWVFYRVKSECCWQREVLTRCHLKCRNIQRTSRWRCLLLNSWWSSKRTSTAESYWSSKVRILSSEGLNERVDGTLKEIQELKTSLQFSQRKPFMVLRKRRTI